MRTEDDLRAAFAEVADRAPVADHVLVPLRSTRRVTSARCTWVLAAAALLLVIAVAVPLTVRGFDLGPAATRRDGYWAMVGQITPPAGWSVTQRAVEGTRESTRLEGPGGSCDVVVYGAGAQPDPLPAGETRTVGGLTGLWVPERTPEPAQLWWSYAQDAWVLVACDPGDEARSFALAGSLRLGEPIDLALPYRLRSLPRGYRVLTVAQGAGPNSVGVMLAAEGRPPISIGIADGPFDPPGPGFPGVEQREINGRAATVREDQHAIEIAVSGGYLLISSGGGSSQSWEPGELDALSDVADALEPADLADPGTWTPARRALP